MLTNIKKAWTWEAAAVLLAISAVVARCLPWRFVFSAQSVVLPGVDPYYHLWRAQHLLQTFPSAPVLDPYLSFPHGGPIPWPAGFDLMIAMPGFIGTGTEGLALWGAFLMPLMGSLGVWLIWRLGKTIFDRPTGLVAEAFGAFSVGFIHYSKIGRIDHHAIVAPVCLAMFLAFLNALKKEKYSKAWSLAGAALSAVSLGSWSVTPPLYFIPVGIMILVYALGQKKPNASTVVRYGLVGTVVLGSLVVRWTGNPRNLFSLYRPSILHLSAYAGFSLLGLAALRGKKWFWSTAILISCCAGLALLIFPQLLSPILTAIEVAAGKSSAYTMASESSPLLFPKNIFDPMRPVLLYSYLAYLWPVFIGALFVHTKKQRHASTGAILLLAWSTMGLTLMIFQERFGEYAAAALFMVTAWAVVKIIRNTIQVLLHAAALRRWLLGLSLGVSLALALWPLAKGLLFLYSNDSLYRQRVMVQFGTNLGKILPSPVGSGGRPEWGLLTGWMEAHPLLETAGIPVSVSSFGTERALAENSKSFAMLLSEDENQVYKNMKGSHLAYVVVSNQLPQARAMATMAGLRRPMVKISTGIDSNGRLFSLTEPLPSYLSSVLARLWLGDGASRWQNGSEHQGLGHFRLVLETPSKENFLDLAPAMLKAFESVQGAKIRGKATPGSVVRLRLAVKTNTQRTFTYSRKTLAKKNGAFSFTVPYPTRHDPFPCRAQGPYRIKADEKVIHVEVSREAVSGGLNIQANP